MIDLKLLGGFDFRQTDGRTDQRTLVVVESLLQLKKNEFDGWINGRVGSLAIIVSYWSGNTD